MKILLLGEVSGVHRELRAGLERRGHRVVQVHSGDAYRQFQADLHFRQTSGTLRGDPRVFASQLASQLRLLPKLAGYDVVQFISPKFFYWRLQEAILPILRRANGTVVMVNVSCSSEFNRFMRTQPYSPCAECKRFDLLGGACPWEREDERAFEERMYRGVDAVVASHFSYHEPLQRLGLPTPVFHVPLPLDLAQITPRYPRATGRLRVYYGETRHGAKGGLHIKPALERLAATHPNDVEVLQSQRLSFADYQRMLDDIDVLIDQANSEGMGMNALYAMARGKVALTGVEQSEMSLLGERPDDVPAVNILPNADDIYRKLVRLVEDRAATVERGRRSVEFIRRHHASDVVAARYETVYRACLDR